MQPRPPPPSAPRPRPPPPSSSTTTSSPTPPNMLNSNTPRSASASSPPSSDQAKSFAEHLLPSCQKDGITPQEEKVKRRKTCRFLQEASRVLKLPRVTLATAMVFFHQFYAVHSFGEHDRFEVAVACLLLAAKTEESPKKLKTVIQECWRLKNMGLRRSQQAAGGESSAGDGSPRTSSSGGSGSNVDSRGYLDLKSEEFEKLKERTLLLERVILHTIGFELSIDHPYKFLVEQIKKMESSRELEYITPPPQHQQHSQQRKMMGDLVQYSMNFANDSMHTSLCLQFPPRIIALTCVYMGAQCCKMKPTGGKSWLEVLDPSLKMENLASIAIQIMELIADKKGCDVAMFADIRADLEKMKKSHSGSMSSSGSGSMQQQQQSRRHGLSGSSSNPSGSSRDMKRQRI